jgi:release factor glutamine methyltransferase
MRADGFSRGSQLHRRHLEDPAPPEEFELLGRRWTLRHGVAERVDVRRSDLFDALGADDRFALIYWNSNFALAPSDYVPETELEHAFFDPGYEVHRRFVAEAGEHLEVGGRLMLGFSDLGSWPQLRAACSAVGLEPVVVRSQKHQLEVPIEFQLVEVRPA